MVRSDLEVCNAKGERSHIHVQCPNGCGVPCCLDLPGVEVVELVTTDDETPRAVLVAETEEEDDGDRRSDIGPDPDDMT